MIPLMLLQTGIYVFWYENRSRTELNVNLELARSMAAIFASYVRDVRRQERAIGQAIGEGISLKLATALLAGSEKEYPAFQSLSFVNMQGLITASSNSGLVGVSVAGQSYFREILSGREWAISNLIEGRVPEEATFIIAERFASAGGAPAGLIMASVAPNALEELAAGVQPAGDLALFDRRGNLVFYSSGVRLGHPNWKDVDPLLRKALEGTEEAGQIAYPVGHEDRLVARVPIEDFGWVAGVRRPAAAVYAPVYRSLIWVTVLNCAVIIVSVTGAVGLSRFVIRRLDLLRGHARRIAEGDLSSRSGVTDLAEMAELEHSFNVMAAEIQNRQASLEKAINDLTRSNQELEQFAYVASHDLQEPLRVVTGFVQLLERRYKGRLDSEADNYIGFITDAVSREQQLINDLLAFARVERTGNPLAATDAEKVLEAAIGNLDWMVRESNAHITHDPLPLVQADRVQLTQLFQNLISNGIKFRQQASPEISVSARSCNGEWVFAVRDNGIGIERQYFEQIFTMFQRLHTRKEYPGTGMGLAICKRIVERHGGRIWLESNPGEGSTFYFTLAAPGEQV